MNTLPLIKYSCVFPSADLDVVSGAYLEQLIEGVCTLLKSNAREVLRSALAFIKVLTQILDQADLAQHVEQLVSGYTQMPVARVACGNMGYQ